MNAKLADLTLLNGLPSTWIELKFYHFAQLISYALVGYSAHYYQQTTTAESKLPHLNFGQEQKVLNP